MLYLQLLHLIWYVPAGSLCRSCRISLTKISRAVANPPVSCRRKPQKNWALSACRPMQQHQERSWSEGGGRGVVVSLSRRVPCSSQARVRSPATHSAPYFSAILAQCSKTRITAFEPGRFKTYHGSILGWKRSNTNVSSSRCVIKLPESLPVNVVSTTNDDPLRFKTLTWIRFYQLKSGYNNKL